AAGAAGAMPAQTSSAFEKQIILAEAMLQRRSRLTMLGRLLWQHWRQSGWLLIVLPLVGLPIAAFITGVGFDWLMLRTKGTAAGSAGGFGVCVLIQRHWQVRWCFLAIRSSSVTAISSNTMFLRGTFG